MLDRESSGTEPDRVRTQMTQFDRRAGERMAQRMLTRCLADVGEQPLPEQEPSPAQPGPRG